MSFFSGISDFNSSGPYAAFWQKGPEDDLEHITVCATSGRPFVTTLQGLLTRTPSGQTYDGSTVDGTMVVADGRFGPMTAKVLWLAAHNAGAGPEALAQMHREAVARDLNGRYLLTIAIMLVDSQLSGVPFGPSTSAHIRLPAGSALIPPRWGIEAPRPTSDMPMLCTQPYLPDAPENLPDAPPGTAPPPPSPEVPPPPPTPEAGGPPIPPAPPGPVDLPPGVIVRPVVQEGITIGPILVAAGVLGLIVWGTSEVMKARRNPRMPDGLRVAWERENPRVPRDLFSEESIDAVWREMDARFPSATHVPLSLSKPEARRVMDHYFGESAKMPHIGYQVKLTNRYALHRNPSNFEIVRS